MNEQLNHWTNPEYGKEYIERNNFADWKLKLGVRGFRRILKGLEFQSLLEVGANIGLNLWYITEWAKKRKQVKELHAVEPFKEAYDTLLEENAKGRFIHLNQAINCSGYELPFATGTVDITMTHGVLIHVAPENLKRMTDEIVRVSRKYVICTEYFSHEPQEVGYKGKEHLIFKRDFGKWYLENYPNLKCINYGFLWQQEFCNKKLPHPYGTLFDDLNYWVFEKK